MRHSAQRQDLEGRLAAYCGTACLSETRNDWHGHLRRWPVYAAATGAALAMATSADASIITGFSGTSISVPRDVGNNHSSGLVDFGTLGHFDLYLSYRFHGYGPVFTTQLRTGGADLFRGVRFARGSGTIRRFHTGDPITSALSFVTAGALHSQSIRMYATHTNFRTVGNFISGQTGIAGFNLGGDLGWIQVKWSSSGGGFPDQLQALNWAIDTIPGQGIFAGEDVADVPEPGTLPLALLALGAAGIAAWRKHRVRA